MCLRYHETVVAEGLSDMWVGQAVVCLEQSCTAQLVDGFHEHHTRLLARGVVDVVFQIVLVGPVGVDDTRKWGLSDPE